MRDADKLEGAVCKGANMRARVGACTPLRQREFICANGVQMRAPSCRPARSAGQEEGLEEAAPEVSASR